MQLDDFSPEQHQALLELMILGMYVDGHLALAEDAMVQRVLAAQTFDSDYARDQYLDATITRAREHAVTEDSAQARAAVLVQQFTTLESKWRVYEGLKDLLVSDTRVAAAESKFLATVREVLGT